MWSDKWVKLISEDCKRIFEMAHKSPGKIIDGFAPNDRTPP